MALYVRNTIRYIQASQPRGQKLAAHWFRNLGTRTQRGRFFLCSSEQNGEHNGDGSFCVLRNKTGNTTGTAGCVKTRHPEDNGDGSKPLKKPLMPTPRLKASSKAGSCRLGLMGTPNLSLGPACAARPLLKTIQTNNPNYPSGPVKRSVFASKSRRKWQEIAAMNDF